jgi:hypothetical protein
MKSVHKSLTKRRRGSRSHLELHTETRKSIDVEDLYWFAMALTGDPDFAANLVANAGKLTSTARGIFRD